MQDINVAESSISFLAYLGVKTLNVDQLFSLVDDDDLLVRTLVAQQLQKKATRVVFDNVAELAEDDRPFVRQTAIYIIGQLGLKERPYELEAISILLKLCNDESPSVRASAAAASGHNVLNHQMDSLVEKKLIELHTDNHEDVREGVAFALGFSNSSDALEVLNKFKNDSSKSVMEYAEISLETLATKGEK